MLMKFGCNRDLDTKAGGYTCLADAAFIIQSVLISPQPGRNKQERQIFKYDGCADPHQGVRAGAGGGGGDLGVGLHSGADWRESVTEFALSLKEHLGKKNTFDKQPSVASIKIIIINKKKINHNAAASPVKR